MKASQAFGQYVDLLRREIRLLLPHNLVTLPYHFNFVKCLYGFFLKIWIIFRTFFE